MDFSMVNAMISAEKYRIKVQNSAFAGSMFGNAGIWGGKKKTSPEITEKEQKAQEESAASVSPDAEGTAYEQMTVSGLQGSSGSSEKSLKPDREHLQNMMVWSEIIGEPVSKKRRRRRVNQNYGYQGNADRG